jgi:hypothetical protein
MPPPLPAEPLEIVRPSIAAWTPASTVKMRKSGVPAAAPRATVSAEAPGPSMVSVPVGLERSGSAVFSVIVPVTSKVMVASSVA